MAETKSRKKNEQEATPRIYTSACPVAPERTLPPSLHHSPRLSICPTCCRGAPSLQRRSSLSLMASPPRVERGRVERGRECSTPEWRSDNTEEQHSPPPAVCGGSHALLTTHTHTADNTQGYSSLSLSLSLSLSVCLSPSHTPNELCTRCHITPTTRHTSPPSPLSLSPLFSRCLPPSSLLLGASSPQHHPALSTSSPLSLSDSGKLPRRATASLLLLLKKKLARLICTAAPSCMSHHYTVAELFYYSNLDNKHNKQDLIELSSDKGVDHVDGDAMNTSEQLVPDIRPRRNNVDNRSIRSSYTERLNKFLSSIIHRPSSIMNDPSSIHHSSSIINNSSSILHHLSAMIHHQ